MGPIKNFKDLNAWKESHRLVLMVYKETKDFPEEEKFALLNQIRRCAVSISSNIAEGFGRNTAKDKIQFYGIARGSLLELESQMLIAHDLGYISEDSFSRFNEQFILVGKLLTGLIKSAANRKI